MPKIATRGDKALRISKTRASQVGKTCAGTVFLNGRIYTMDPTQPLVEALAIDDGKIQAVGTSEEIARFINAETQPIDLAGRMAMPGLIDAHCHPVKGAIALLFTARIAFSDDLDAIARIISAAAQQADPTQWIIGGRWGSGLFDGLTDQTPRAWLDKVVATQPVYLRDDSGHNGCANSAALAALGIDGDTNDPAGGRIVRAADGTTPNGLLLEQADVEARARIPDWTSDQYRAGVQEMMRIAHGFGIVGVNDADATEPLLNAYQTTDRDGGLQLYVAASISTPYGARSTPLDYAHIESLCDNYASEHVDTRFVKIYEDGVPTSARTAAMLSPYLAGDGFAADHDGWLHVDEETLTQDIAALEARGFTVKLHTAGDRSVRVALNAIERAHAISGREDLRHELAHAGFVDDADIPRFAALNAVADLSPYIWFPSPLNDSVVTALGERGRRYWPIRDLLETGAPVLTGSDWPAAVASMDPWIGIETMVTRKPPGEESGPTLWGTQAIGLTRVLSMFTLESARALRRDHQTGSLEAGKSADLIVLNQNLFDIEPWQISATRVLETWFEGQRVFKADPD
ncbi:MAG: amidohydrolase [Pseudomonadota bacterium]